MTLGSNSRIWDRARLEDPHAQPDKAKRVRAMFGAIAPTYALVNRILSLGRDAYWRRTAVALAAVTASDRVLDVACGTGDSARAFSRASPAVAGLGRLRESWRDEPVPCVPALIVGCDYSEEMLALAAGRNGLRYQPEAPARVGPQRNAAPAFALAGASSRYTASRNQGQPMVGGDDSAVRAEARGSGGRVPETPFAWCRGDALSLPFADESFTIVSCAFGVRNFQDLPRGFREAFRVLKPGGRVVILEFAVPQAPLLGRLYLFYFRRVLPRLATLISRDRTGAYQYLPSSVLSFAKAEDMITTLRAAGFGRVDHRPLTMGVVSVFIAWKDA